MLLQTVIALDELCLFAQLSFPFKPTGKTVQELAVVDSKAVVCCEAVAHACRTQQCCLLPTSQKALIVIMPNVALFVPCRSTLCC